MASRTALTAAAALLLAGCAASITSQRFDPATPGDGILYKLPVREFSVAATYQLESCAPLQLNLAEVSVASVLLPSPDPADWFEIDPAALNRPFSSVDPATIELNNGMLSVVGLKTTGTAAQVVSLLKQAGDLATAAGPATLTCTAGARSAVAASQVLAAEIAERRAMLQAAEQQMLDRPTTDSDRRVKLARERLAESIQARDKLVGRALRKTIIYRLTPGAPTNCAAEPRSSAAPDALCAWPSALELADWFELASPAEPQLTDAQRQAFRVTMRLTDVAAQGAQAALPARGNPYAGIYYRRPATATVILEVAVGSSGPVYRSVPATLPIPQLGTLQRIPMRGAAFGSRNVAVAFDGNGELKKYEVTSKGMAEAMTATLEAAEAP